PRTAPRSHGPVSRRARTSSKTRHREACRGPVGAGPRLTTNRPARRPELVRIRVGDEPRASAPTERPGAEAARTRQATRPGIMWEFDIKGEAARFARERKAGRLEAYRARPGARGARPPAGSLARRFEAATPGGPTSASSSP